MYYLSAYISWHNTVLPISLIIISWRLANKGVNRKYVPVSKNTDICFLDLVDPYLMESGGIFSLLRSHMIYTGSSNKTHQTHLANIIYEMRPRVQEHMAVTFI